MVASPAARPLVAIPARFSVSASALRYGGVVAARALVQAVYAAGGEPLLVLPEAGDPADRLGWADAVLLPGGGDLDPAAYGEQVVSDAVYDVDRRQDAFDLAVASWALDVGVPLLAVCRGLQVVNVALGGTLHQHVEPAHRHLVHEVEVEPASRLAATLGTSRLTASCYHHQTVARLGRGLAVVATAQDRTVEGIELAAADGFFLGVQWHPEDTAADDPVQRALLESLVEAGRRQRSAAG